MSDHIVRRTDDVFTEEALKANDGKTVYLTDKPGGQVIGKAKLKYDPKEKALTADLQVDDPKVAEVP